MTPETMDDSSTENRQSFAVGSPRNSSVAEAGSQNVDIIHDADFENYISSYRGDIDVLDAQIKELDRAIEAEKQNVLEIKAELDRCFRGRSRLIFLRTAMLNFVLELERRTDKSLPYEP
jgi:hypothetical protein